MKRIQPPIVWRFSAVLIIVLFTSAIEAQQVDLTRLTHPETAERLSLTDQQRAELQTLLLDQIKELSEAADEESKSTIREAYATKAAQLMTEEQRAKYLEDRPAENLKFQFREMKWDQVLSWFAAQQDLTLIMDRVPPGSFTYSDTRSYTPSQAIDLLNSVLMTRGFTLVRREKMLMVMELSDSIPIELLPRVTLEELPERGRFELVSVVFPLAGRPVDAVLSEVKPFLSSFGTILPLSRGSQVLVVENAGKMQTINELIAAVPVPEKSDRPSPPPGPVFASYSLGNLEVSTALETIQQLIPSENITADAKTGVLSAFVVPSQQTAIKSALDAMLQKQSELPEMQAVAFKLQSIRPEEFREQILSMVPSARIMTTQDRAVVLAAPEDLPMIRESLVSLDIEPIENESSVRTFRIPPLRVSSFEASLRSFLPNSQVAGNTEVGSLIVKGSPEDLRLAEEMVEIWMEASEELQLKIYPLTLQQKERRKSVGTMPGELAELRVLENPNGTELIVWASESQHRKFAEYLAQLDQPLPVPEAMLPHVYSLDLEEPAIVVELLATEFPDSKFTLNALGDQLTAIATSSTQAKISERLEQFKQQLPTRPERRMVAYQLPNMSASGLQQTLANMVPNLETQIDTDRDRLLVWAESEQHSKIEALIAVLAEKPSVEQQRVVVVYSLNHAAPISVKAALDQLDTKATIIAEEKLKQLMITGTLSEHAILQPIVSQIDRPRSNQTVPEVRGYDVQSFRASEILATLQSLWPEMKLSADNSSNKIIASGTEEELQQLSVAIQRLLDSPGGKPQVVKSYSVPVGDMQSLPGILTQVAPQAVVSADPVSRTVTVLASEEHQQRIAQALEQLSATAKSAKRAVPYEVKPAQVSAVQTSLRSLFPYLEMSADPASGQLIVLAPQSVQEEVARVIEMLIEGPNSIDRSLQVFPVDSKLLETPEFLRSLRSLLSPQVTLEAGPQNKSLVVIGTPDEIAETEKTLANFLEQWPESEELTSAVYQLKHASTGTVLALLQPLVPRVNLVQDPASRTIAATARSEDQQKIAELLSMVDVPRENDRFTKVYRLNRGTGQALSYVLASLMPEARLFGDPNGGGLLATANEQEHEMIQGVVNEYGGTDDQLETRVFQLDRSDSRSLQGAIQEWNNLLKVVSDRGSNSLIVTGPTEAMNGLEKIISEVDGGALGDQMTHFYSVDAANPNTLASALQANFPKATIAGDAVGGGVFVTAAEAQHEEIERLVEQLNAEPSRLPSLKSFTIQHVSPASVAQALDDAFGRRSTANVSFNEESRTIFVVGTRDELRIAEQLVQAVDIQEPARESRQVKVFPVTGLDGRSLVETLETVFRDDPDRIDIRQDLGSGRITIFGLPEQLRRAEQVLAALEPAPRTLKVLRLGSMETYAAKEAIDALFTDTPYNLAPLITTDQDQQQLLVKATDEQHQQIESLLTQMGEPLDGREASSMKGLLPQGSGSPSRIRSIPMQRNSQSILEEIQRLWPELRGNRLRVISPSKDADSAANVAKPSIPVSSETTQPELAAGAGNAFSEFVPQEDSAAPPVIIVVGPEKWTLASEDTEALELMEGLIDLIQNPRIEPVITSGNYSLYLLQRASASETQATLQELFSPSDSRRSRLPSSLADMSRRIRIVADDRTNALIVSGSVNDRKLIEELLGVLDSEELLGNLQQILPTTIALRSATAQQAESIIRDIYRSQLTASARRRPLPIPEGVSSEVATLLQQISAQASGPVLAITSDEVTNSIVLRAPQELTNEIRQFIKSLDEQTAVTPARRVELIRLQSTNASNLERALRRLLSR